jgi:C-terminal processing protease CtpA/Prc
MSRKESLSSAIDVGDIVLEIDGEDAMKKFNRILPDCFGATKYTKLHEAHKRLIEGEAKTSVHLKFLNSDKGEYELDLRRISWRPEGPPPRPSNKFLNEKTGYIRIQSWGGFTKSDFDDELVSYKSVPNLIIDVRGNGGGSDALAADVVSRFIDQPVVCSISFHRRSGTAIYDKTIELAYPRGPWKYPGKVVVLIDPGCASACEHFVSGMFEAGATLIGTPTSGACGWSKQHDLPGGVTLRCSLTFPLHGKVPSPLHGMEPHIWALPTIEDIKKGNDYVLEKALDFFDD